MLRSIATDVYRLENGCNVYLLKSGERGMLIDIGGGEVLRCLEQVGISRIDRALLTHAHRDQCLGLPALIRHGAVIVAPRDEEARLGKEQVRRFWNEHFPLANSTTSYSVIGTGYDEVECRLAAGDVLEWEHFRVEAVGAGGHTRGQLAYLLKRREGDILFCGDALHAGGKIWKGYTLDWDHWTDSGAAAAVDTLERFRELGPGMIAPSHGQVLQEDADEQLGAAIERLRAYGSNKSFEYFNVAAGGRGDSRRVPAMSAFTAAGVTAHQLSEHLWIQDNSYFLISEATQKCLMVDCGYAYMDDFVPEFLRMAGCSAVDVVIPTHAHDDHAGHLNVMKKRYGAEIWALDLIRDVVEAPWRYWHPWSRWKDIAIDRTFGDGETVKWNEYTLTFHWYPGQTAFGSAMETNVDGRHVMFAADNFFPVEQWNGTGGVMGLNRGLPPGYAYAAEKTMAIRPEWVLAAHEGPFFFDEGEFRNRLAWAVEVEHRMKDLTPPGDGGWQAHFDPHALSVYPFISEALRGESVVVRLIGEEVGPAAVEPDWIWELPAGFEVHPVDAGGEYEGPDAEMLRRLRFSGAGTLRMRPFEIRIPEGALPGQYGVYVAHKSNPVLEALCVVKVEKPANALSTGSWSS